MDTCTDVSSSFSRCFSDFLSYKPGIDLLTSLSLFWNDSLIAVRAPPSLSAWALKFPFLALCVPLHQGHTNPRPGSELHGSYRIALSCQLDVISWFPFDPKEGKCWVMLSYFNTCTHSTSLLRKLISWLVVWGCFWDLSPVRWRCMRIAQKLQSF